MPEFYPMPSFATLLVPDLPAAARWYQEALGFQIVYEMPGSDGSPLLIHLRRSRYQDLLLVPEPPGFSAGRHERGLGVTLTFMVEESVDTLADRARAAGAEILAGPEDRPWNVREVILRDLHGYRLTFASHLDSTSSFEEVVERIQQQAQPPQGGTGPVVGG